MCELLTLQAPYSDIRKDEDGKQLMSWDQVVAMTHKKDVCLRPTIPEDMDRSIAALIRRCWGDDPELRPSFRVIMARLQSAARKYDERRGTGGLRTIVQQEVEGFSALCRGVHDLLWLFRPSDWDEETAAALLGSDFAATANDETIRTILSTEKGPNSIKALGWIMFGGLEDGAEILPEPLLEENIICDIENGSALVTVNFSVKQPPKQHQWTGKDRREFDELEQALAQASKDLLTTDETEVLEKAVAESKADIAPKRKLKLKKKMKKKKRGAWRGRGRNNSNEDKGLKGFMKAARYVRGLGAGKIHPSAKLRLLGLRLQAQRGDATAEDGVNDDNGGADAVDAKSSASVLRELKLKAWRGEKGKDRKTAMLEYVELLTSIVPQWRVSHLLRAHDPLKDTKPKAMVWVLKINVKQRSAEEVESMLESRPSSRVLSQKSRDATRRFYASSIEVLQSSTSANTKLWNEESTAARAEENNVDNVTQGEKDLFVAAMRKKLTRQDCIMDKTKHKTIEEQRAYYSARMLRWAREGHDEDDGWKFKCKTVANSKFRQQLEVHERSVECMPVKQLRSVAHTPVDLNFLFSDFRDGLGRKISKEYGDQYSSSSSKAMRTTMGDYHWVYFEKRENWVLSLQVSLP